jgi:hypothetical protein
MVEKIFVLNTERVDPRCDTKTKGKDGRQSFSRSRTTTDEGGCSDQKKAPNGEVIPQREKSEEEVTKRNVAVEDAIYSSQSRA